MNELTGGKVMYCNAKYVKSKVEISLGAYLNGRLAIKLIDAQDGCPCAVATVNIPDYPLPEDEVIIKNWSENEGVLEFLIENGLVEDTGKVVSTGRVVANVVKITDKLRAMVDSYK